MSDERIQEMLPEHWNPGQSLKELMTRAIALYEEMKNQLKEKNDLRTQIYSERLRRAVREIQERTNSEWFPSQGMTLLLEMEEMERALIEVFKNRQKLATTEGDPFTTAEEEDITQEKEIDDQEQIWDKDALSSSITEEVVRAKQGSAKQPSTTEGVLNSTLIDQHQEPFPQLEESPIKHKEEADLEDQLDILKNNMTGRMETMIETMMKKMQAAQEMNHKMMMDQIEQHHNNVMEKMIKEQQKEKNNIDKLIRVIEGHQSLLAKQQEYHIIQSQMLKKDLAEQKAQSQKKLEEQEAQSLKKLEEHKAQSLKNLEEQKTQSKKDLKEQRALVIQLTKQYEDLQDSMKKEREKLLDQIKGLSLLESNPPKDKTPTLLELLKTAHPTQPGEPEGPTVGLGEPGRPPSGPGGQPDGNEGPGKPNGGTEGQGSSGGGGRGNSNEPPATQASSTPPPDEDYLQLHIKEAQHFIKDCKENMKLEEKEINDLQTDELQVIVRTQDRVYQDAISEIKNMIMNMGREAQHCRATQETQNTVVNIQNKLRELSGKIRDAQRMIKDQARKKNILLSKPDHSYDKLYQAPTFDGETGFHVYQYIDALNQFLQQGGIPNDKAGGLIMKTLTGPAKETALMHFTQPNPSTVRLLTMLKENYGQPYYIIKQMIQEIKHVGTIPHINTASWDDIHSKTVEILKAIEKMRSFEKHCGNIASQSTEMVSALEDALPYDKQWQYTENSKNKNNQEKIGMIASILKSLENSSLTLSQRLSHSSDNKSQYQEQE